MKKLSYAQKLTKLYNTFCKPLDSDNVIEQLPKHKSHLKKFYKETQNDVEQIVIKRHSIQEDDNIYRRGFSCLTDILKYIACNIEQSYFTVGEIEEFCNRIDRD